MGVSPVPGEPATRQIGGHNDREIHNELLDSNPYSLETLVLYYTDIFSVGDRKLRQCI